MQATAYSDHHPSSNSSTRHKNSCASDSDIAVERITESLVIAFVIAVIVKVIAYIISSAKAVAEL